MEKEKEPTLSTVNRMIIRAVMDKDAHNTLSAKEQEELLKETEWLSVHWLMHAYRKARKVSLDKLVQVTQKTTVHLMDHLYDRNSQLVSGFSVIMQRNLLRFLEFLQVQFKKHFDFDAPLPKLAWEQMREKILDTLLPEEQGSLRDTDASLLKLMQEQCEASIGNRPPSFNRGFYWVKLTDIFKHTLRQNDATLQTVFTLITCNFNCSDFVQYVMNHYGKDLPPSADATNFWVKHMQLINGIPERTDMVLNPQLPHCKQLLFAAIDNEIQAFRYTQQTQQLNHPVVNLPTALNVAELALWHRLKIKAGMVQIENKRDYFRKLAQVYGMAGSSLNDEYLYEKYYKIDPATKKRIMGYLVAMRNTLMGL